MATLKINVQYYYNFNEGGEPCWKGTGGTSFIIEGFNADTVFYDRERAIGIMKELVARESTPLEKFEYISYELTFAQPIKIPNSRFEELYAQIAAE